MTRVSNQTNNLDPTAVNSRVFVGNLNTYLVNKEDVESVFRRYGRVIGISMHKGYAFVQYTDCYDARNAVLGEDGRTIAGQILDVNMVSEPKPHQLTRKRQGSPRNSVDVFGDRLPRSAPGSSSGASSAAPSPTRLVLSPPSTKRLRMTQPVEAALFMHGVIASANRGKARLGKPAAGIAPPLYCSEPDILVCGTCKQLFSGLQGLVDHKRRACRLRFTCRCQDTGPSVNAPSTPQCVQCDAQCDSWWDLAYHAEEAHGIAIYRHADEADPVQQSQREVSTSPGPNEEAEDSAGESATLNGVKVETFKVEKEGMEDAACNGCQEQNGNSDDDQSERLKQTEDVSQDKCVDTTDLLIG